MRSLAERFNSDPHSKYPALERTPFFSAEMEYSRVGPFGPKLDLTCAQANLPGLISTANSSDLAAAVKSMEPRPRYKALPVAFLAQCRSTKGAKRYFCARRIKPSSTGRVSLLRWASTLAPR